MPDKPDPKDVLIAELKEKLAAEQLAHEETKAIKPMVVVEKPEPPKVLAPSRADLHTFEHGQYKHRQSGEMFQLKVVKDDPQGRTHKLANDLHFHESSEDELRKDYDKA